MIEVIRSALAWVWLSVSVTTRRKRDYEVDGEHYHFVTRTEFERLSTAASCWSGPSSPATFTAHPGRRSRRGSRRHPGLLKIDLQGARQVREAMPEAQLVFLAPPSREELKRRLVGRGTETRRPSGAGWSTPTRSWRPRRSST